MLITFKSRAAGDVIMFGAVAQQILARLDKDAKAPRGIFTVPELANAIIRLKQMVSDEKQRGEVPAESAEDDGERGMSAPVALWQRVVPVIELFEYALKDEQPVLWE